LRLRRERYRRDELNFDWLLAVFFSRNFDLLGLLRVPRALVMELGSQTSATFRLRWNRAVAQHPGIERLFWHEDNASNRQH
jgi:hypothetical protein